MDDVNEMTKLRLDALSKGHARAIQEFRFGGGSSDPYHQPHCTSPNRAARTTTRPPARLTSPRTSPTGPLFGTRRQPLAAARPSDDSVDKGLRLAGPAPRQGAYPSQRRRLSAAADTIRLVCFTCHTKTAHALTTAWTSTTHNLTTQNTFETASLAHPAYARPQDNTPHYTTSFTHCFLMASCTSPPVPDNRTHSQQDATFTRGPRHVQPGRHGALLKFATQRAGGEAAVGAQQAQYRVGGVSGKNCPRGLQEQKGRAHGYRQ